MAGGRDPPDWQGISIFLPAEIGPFKLMIRTSSGRTVEQEDNEKTDVTKNFCCTKSKRRQRLDCEADD